MDGELAIFLPIVLLHTQYTVWTAWWYDRLSASSCRPSVCNALHYGSRCTGLVPACS